MIDVFVRTVSLQSELRLAFRHAAVARWEMEEVCLRWLCDMGIRQGRQIAEEEATTDPYIVTDDDVLIVGKDWVKRGREAMLGNKEFAVCSSLSLIEGENLATGTGTIYDMHAVGAPMWIRKGVLKEFPEMDLNSECGVIHKMVLDLGYREGLINGLRHNHLGHGFSSNPALHWGF